MKSLRKQLSLGLTLSLVGLLTLQWAVVTFTIDHMIQSQMAARMQQEAEGILAGVTVNGRGQLVLAPHVMTPSYQRPFSGRYFIVMLGTQKAQSRSWWDVELPVSALNVGEEQVTHVTGPESQPLLLLGHGYRKQQQTVTIYIAESLVEMQQSLRMFHWLYGVFSLLGLLALLVLQRWIVVNTLNPLQQIKENLAKVASGELQQIHASGPAEVMPLVNEFNRILKSASHKTRRSRLAIGNLAHGLKTRLAQLQLLSADATAESDAQLRQMVQSCSADIYQDVERELKRARLMGDVYSSQTTDLEVELPKLVATLQKIYSEKTVAFAWQHDGQARVMVDREDMLELLGNVLDNAFKWCRSQVQLTISVHSAIHITVEDDGPGSHAPALETLLQRGMRMDESKPGSGLGLAIVQDIVQHYQGNVVLTHSERLRGLRVQLTLMPA
ncbi:sensor histidine kinase [Methylophilus aquaticus]|uniref:histidine kinase n=1 Tax=Methylophilus aquaticus TaxID=1971610 RepID=A0ABT9JRR1_9PROT|nr:sensor histidine kinase [Methylophilus aquaticus]MDP8567230.1 sensor histidine kinase [Methylophilus aquaticus]